MYFVVADGRCIFEKKNRSFIGSNEIFLWATLSFRISGRTQRKQIELSV